MVHGVIRDRAHTLLAQRECVLVENLTPLNELPRLREIVCINTRVKNLTSLDAMTTTLWSLNCSYTRVRDLGPLATLAALRSLDCSNTRVKYLTAVAALTSLQSLDCRGTPVKALSPLSSLPSLQSLNCSNTRVTDLSSLACDADHTAELGLQPYSGH